MLLVKRLPRFVLVIEADSLSLQQESAPRAPSEPVLTRAVCGNPAIELASLTQAIPERSDPQSAARGSLRVLVSDRWLRWLTLPWNDELLSSKTAGAQYDLHAQMMFGAAPLDLVYSSAYAPFGRPQCVAAIPVDLLQAIHQFASRQNLSADSLRPLSLESWERQRKSIEDRSYAFGVIERGAVAVLIVRNGRLENVISQDCDAEPAAELDRLWRRMRLRDSELTSLAKLQVADLTGRAEQPSHAVNLSNEPRGEFNFVSRAAPVSGWRRVLLVAGVAFLVAGAADAFDGYRECAALSEDVVPNASASDVRTPGSRSEPQRSRAQIRAVNQAITSLNLPVGTLLQALQPPSEIHTALLGLDLSDVQGDTRTASVKITAESRSATEMTSYVDLLSRAGMFDTVYLTRHEVDVKSAEHPYRYIVEASWKQ